MEDGECFSGSITPWVSCLVPLDPDDPKHGFFGQHAFPLAHEGKACAISWSL